MMNNELTIEQLKAVLLATSEQETKCINLSSRIRAALVPFEGKQITRRMEKAVAKAMPEAVIHYTLDVFGCKISVWGGDTGRTFDTRFIVYFGGYKPSLFSLAEYDKSNSSCGTAALERIAGRNLALANTEALQAVVDNANATKLANAMLKAALQTLTDTAGQVFSISEVESLVEKHLGR